MLIFFLLGFWTKFHYAIYNREYTNTYTNLPYDIYAEMSTFNHANLQIRSLNSAGLPVRLLGYEAYDCTVRPWYTTAKANLAASWTAPFFQINKKPAVSYVIPIITNSSYAGRTGFVGALGFNVQFDQISQHLMRSYQNSSTSVFIVEKSSGYLIASSLPAMSYYTTSGGTNVRAILIMILSWKISLIE